MAQKFKKIKKKVIKAKLVYNKELEHFYDEIQVHPPRSKINIYHISPPPVDVEKLTKIFVNMDGVNPLEFDGTGNFSLPKKEFYLKLFTHR